MYIDTVVTASIVTVLAMQGSLMGMGIYAFGIYVKMRRVRPEASSGVSNPTTMQRKSLHTEYVSGYVSGTSGVARIGPALRHGSSDE